MQSFSQRPVLCFRWSTGSRGHSCTWGKKNFRRIIKKKQLPSSLYNCLIVIQFIYLKPDSNKNSWDMYEREREREREKYILLYNNILKEKIGWIWHSIFNTRQQPILDCVSLSKSYVNIANRLIIGCFNQKLTTAAN